jgi:hypothetical protein
MRQDDSFWHPSDELIGIIPGGQAEYREGSA